MSSKNLSYGTIRSKFIEKRGDTQHENDRERDCEDTLKNRLKKL
jgi:hypothetical protein